MFPHNFRNTTAEETIFLSLPTCFQNEKHCSHTSKICTKTRTTHNQRQRLEMQARPLLLTQQPRYGLIRFTIHLFNFVEALRKFIIAIINSRGVSTKLNKYIVFTMQTYKKLNIPIVVGKTFNGDFWPCLSQAKWKQSISIVASHY